MMSNTYTAIFTGDLTGIYDIDADDEDEAIEAAWRLRDLDNEQEGESDLTICQN